MDQKGKFMSESHGKTLGEAIHKSLHRERIIQRKTIPELTKKGRFIVLAPPLFWGFWTEIWAQFGVVGPNADRHRAIVNVSFDTQSGGSSFDVEIKGGDRFIRSVGPGSERITITGNVATALSIRCKSHSLGQSIIVWV